MNPSFPGLPALIEVGSPSIDAQHREIFELAASFSGNGDDVRVMKSISVLCNYVLVHFREEEEMMLACGFPGYEAHRRQHEKCREMLTGLLARAKAMSMDELAREVGCLVNGWIFSHIMTADIEYAPYLRGDLAEQPDALDEQD